MCVIYILKLEQGKYYVGKTNDIDNRLDKHYNNTGSYWTTKYKPIDPPYAVYYNCDDFDEDKYTIQMMAKYGIDDVRGGSFTKIQLAVEEISLLTKMINNACNNCFNCHTNNHFANVCPYDKIKNTELVIMRNNIIKLSKEISDDFITVCQLLDILIIVDKITFNITKKQLNKICQIIDNTKIRNIGLTKKLGLVNYVNFAIGISFILDKIYKEKTT